MSAQLTDEEALNRVASYCSTAEHCRAEINEKYNVGELPMKPLRAF